MILRQDGEYDRRGTRRQVIESSECQRTQQERNDDGWQKGRNTGRGEDEGLLVPSVDSTLLAILAMQTTDGIFPRAPQAFDYPHIVQGHRGKEHLGRIRVAELVKQGSPCLVITKYVCVYENVKVVLDVKEAGSDRGCGKPKNEAARHRRIGEGHVWFEVSSMPDVFRGVLAGTASEVAAISSAEGEQLPWMTSRRRSDPGDNAIIHRLDS